MQEDVANFLGMGRSNVGHIENDRVIPTSSDLKKIAELLNTTTDYLLGKEEYTLQEQQLMKDIILSDEEMKNVLNFTWEDEKLTEEEMKNVLKYIRHLLIMRDEE